MSASTTAGVHRIPTNDDEQTVPTIGRDEPIPTKLRKAAAILEDAGLTATVHVSPWKVELQADSEEHCRALSAAFGLPEPSWWTSPTQPDVQHFCAEAPWSVAATYAPVRAWWNRTVVQVSA